MVGAIVGGAISAVGGIASSAMQSGNVGAAQKTSQRNLELMLPQIQQNYVNQQGLFQPFYGAGQQGLGAETDLLGLNGPDAAAAAMANFQASPGYQYQLEQGLRGVDALGAAGRALPGVRSGATLKAEQKYGSDLANLDFGNYFTRLNSLATMGDTAANQLAVSGNNLIAGMQGNATSQNALAIGSANAQNSIIGNAGQGIGSAVNTLLQRPGVDKALTGLFSGGSSSQPDMGVIPTPSGGFNPSGNTWYF